MKQPLRSTTETDGNSTGDPLPKQTGSLREIHYRNSRDLPLRLCTFASLRLFLPNSLTRGHHPHPQPPAPASEGEPRFYRDAEYEKKPEPCGAPKAGVRRR